MLRPYIVSCLTIFAGSERGSTNERMTSSLFFPKAIKVLTAQCRMTVTSLFNNSLSRTMTSDTRSGLNEISLQIVKKYEAN